MAAKFILSLDCEGKWGVADGLTAKSREMLADDRLEAAYNQIVRLLDEHGIAATFAFAGLFSQSAEQFAAVRPQVEAMALRAPAICSLRSTISTLTGRDGTDRTSWRS